MSRPARLIRVVGGEKTGTDMDAKAGAIFLQ